MKDSENLDNCIGEFGKKASHGCLILGLLNDGDVIQRERDEERFLSNEPRFHVVKQTIWKEKVKLQRAHGGYLGTQRR